MAEVTLSGTTGADTLTGAYGVEDLVAVNALEGGDLVFITGSAYLVVDAGAGNDSVAAMLGGGQNTHAEFFGGAGDDLIQISGSSSFVSVESGAGNNIILLDVTNVEDENVSTLTILGGSGVDAVVGKTNGLIGERYDQSFNTYAGDDLIRLQITAEGKVDTVITTGTGHDIVNLSYVLGAGIGSQDNPSLEAKLGDGDDVIFAGKGLDGDLDGFFNIYGQDGDDLIRIEGHASSTIYGGAGDDRIVFNPKTGGFSTNSSGGAGNDVFVAGLSEDMFGGDAGADVFVFGSAAKANFDVIVRFQHGVDRIDLSRFMEDATFVGAKKFSGDGPEIRFATDKKDFTYLSGDVNGDGKADWKVFFNGFTGAVTASDLIL